MTFDSDYAYLQVFIDILRQLVDIILKLFKGLSGEPTTPSASSESDENPQASA